MLQASKIRKGDAIIYEGEAYVCTDFHFHQPAKGPSFCRCKIKSFRTGKVNEVTFKSSDVIEEANVEKGNAQYLYASGQSLTFMDQSSYEQYEISSEMVGSGNASKFLKEGTSCTILFIDGVPFGAEIPKIVDLKVTESAPAVKGDTSGNATKTVVLETGHEVDVPMFIKQGEVVRVNTDTGLYVERA